MIHDSSYNASIKTSNYVHDKSVLVNHNRTYCQMTADRALSIFREINYAFGNLQIRIIDYYSPKYDNINVQSEKTWHKESEGLYVLIHGLNGHPGIWQTHINQLESNRKVDLFIPYIPLKGNGPIEAVATPLLKVLEDYAEKKPNRPICLIGVSNGGRICTWLETQMRHIRATPIRISTIAAVHFGSSRMDLVKACHEWTGWSLGYDISVVDDLCYGSKKAMEILDAVLEPLPNGVVRDFEFYASTEDMQVPELSSSLPKLTNHHQHKYHVVHGYDHNGIVAGVAAEQIRSCSLWMKKYTKQD